MSYDFPDSGNKSVNFYTSKEVASVKYKDLDHAIQQSLQLLRNIHFDTEDNGKAYIWYGKSDIKSAFCLVPLLPGLFWLLVMKAENPESGKVYYFMDKCLPFGHRISCAIFQSFLDALAHLIQFKLASKMLVRKVALTNYLDNFLFAALLKRICDQALKAFLQLAETLEKTEWGSTWVIFLGVLLDGEKYIIAIPEDKRIRALNSLEELVNKKKATVKQIQSLAGLLNFLNRAIVPGHAFTRRMYAKFTGLVDLGSMNKYRRQQTSTDLKTLSPHQAGSGVQVGL